KKRRSGGEQQATTRAARARVTSRGSGGIYAPARLSPPSLGLPQQSTGVYIPPPVSNPSAQINQLNQSFPLNGGLGLNPTNRDSYIRYNLTRKWPPQSPTGPISFRLTFALPRLNGQTSA